MTTAIRVRNLSKRYILNHQSQERYMALRDEIVSGAKRIAHKLAHPFAALENDSMHEIFWALKDVSFDIQQGDRVGIIGRNGAGKSTMLKILSRITEPTTGRISIRGRVASLLEVGTGFHPELTGRENIFLNGAILGMSKAEIKKKFDEIVAFAEVEKFLDTPVKRYSSGMYVRLAFAVAAHLEPEILIVDEVLAVGDAQFQRKCLGKMKDVGQEGRTVLFVSHNIAAIRALCNMGILLSDGQIASIGSVENILSNYMHQNSKKNGYKYTNLMPDASQSKAEILEACVLGPSGEPSPIVYIDQVSSIKIFWRLNISVPYLRLGIEIIDDSGVTVLTSMDTDSTDLHGKPRIPGVFYETVIIPPYLLMPGNYTVKAFAGMPGIERIIEIDDMLKFEIVDNCTHLSKVSNDRRGGYIALPLQWNVSFVPTN